MRRRRERECHDRGKSQPTHEDGKVAVGPADVATLWAVGSIRAKRLVLPVLALVLSAVAGGCGGGGGASDDTRSATRWADGFCSAIASWRGSLSSTVASLRSGSLTADAVTSAVNDAGDATKKLGSKLRKLGAPDTKSGQRAKQQVDDLAGRLENEVGTIAAVVKQASGGAGVLTAIAVGSRTLARMRTEVTRTLERLRRLDNGALTNGFLQADACNRLFAA